MTKIASQHRTTFWKHARNYGKQIEVEELFNRWSISNRFSKELDTQVRNLINNDLQNVKKAIQLSTEEFETLMQNSKGATSTEPFDIAPSNGSEPLGSSSLDTMTQDNLEMDPLSSMHEEAEPIAHEKEEEQQILPDMINS